MGATANGPDSAPSTTVVPFNDGKIVVILDCRGLCRVAGLRQRYAVSIFFARYPLARRWVQSVILLTIVVVGILIARLYWVQQQARPAETEPLHFPVVRVSAQQAVQAMNADTFFADYDQTTLLIRGTISSISRQVRANTLVLGANGTGTVVCDLGNRSTAGRVGQTITIESVDPQQDISRASNGLMVQDCRIPGS